MMHAIKLSQNLMALKKLIVCLLIHWKLKFYAVRDSISICLNRI
jgi:hypothetical protein